MRRALFARNLIAENGPEVEPRGVLVDLVETYRTLVAPIANEVVGHIDGGSVITRTSDADGSGDSPLGNLIADVQKADETVVTDGEPIDVALMNPGGIRADLVENAAGDVTYEAAFSVQPFNNFLVSMDLTGAQIRAVLNEQWNDLNEAAPRILQVSGLEYTWDASRAAQPDTDAIVGDVLVDHDGDPATALVPLEDGATYRVVANNFIADGGDDFPTFIEGEDRLVGGLDIDAFRAYLEAHDPVAVTATDRITRVP